MTRASLKKPVITPTRVIAGVVAGSTLVAAGGYGLYHYRTVKKNREAAPKRRQPGFDGTISYPTPPPELEPSFI